MSGSKQIRIGLIAMAAMTCATASSVCALSANSGNMTNDQAVQSASQTLEAEITCLNEMAGIDAMMNFAESATAGQDDDKLRESIAVEMADCAKQYRWDAETQTLAFGAFLYSSLLQYNLEGTGTLQFDGPVIFEIWSALSDADKVGLVAEDAKKNTELLSRVTAVIRSKVPYTSEEHIPYVLNALASATLYVDVRTRWSQKAAGS